MEGSLLYSFRRCPYAMRARMAIAISGLRCELREVKLSAKPAEMLAASPKGTVPVLITSAGQIIDESRDIMRAVLAASDPECWLERDDPALIDANDTTFKSALDRYKYPHRYNVDPNSHRSAGGEFLQTLEERLSGSAHLCGRQRGFADAAIMPFVRQFAAVDAAWFEAQPWPKLRVWLSGHIASSLFTQVMIREKPWQSGDTPVFFPA